MKTVILTAGIGVRLSGRAICEFEPAFVSSQADKGARREAAISLFG